MAGDQPARMPLRCKLGGDPGDPGDCGGWRDEVEKDAAPLFFLLLRRADFPVTCTVEPSFFVGDGDRGTALPKAGLSTTRLGACLLYACGLT